MQVCSKCFTDFVVVYKYVLESSSLEFLIELKDFVVVGMSSSVFVFDVHN